MAADQRPPVPRPNPIPTGLFSGPPGGLAAPPGGLPPQALAPLAPLPQLTGAPRGPAPGAPLGGMPGGGPPGAGAPLALPDLAAAARRALESVADAELAAGPAAPVGVPAPAIGEQSPHVAAAPPPAAGLWRAPAPPPTWAPAQREHARIDTREQRDGAQRIGDRLYPLVQRLRDSKLSWVAVVALFGITVPIILLRQSFDARLRWILSVVVFLFWLGLIQDLVG